jgi:short-subunit dehydrogenase
MTSFAQIYGGAALVTGASSGFGREFVLQLARRGMDVVLVARRREVLEDLAAEVRSSSGVEALVVEQDLLAADADLRVREAVSAAGMSVGLLVNNAGFGTYGLFQEQDAAFEGRMVDLNCRVPVMMTHRFLGPMLERGRGGIIMVSSMAAFQPTPWMATYGATKAFDLMLSEALWAELSPKGIHVLALCPGKVETGFQAVAGADTMPDVGTKMSAEKVVTIALDSLGKRPTVVPGFMSKMLIASQRIAPRRFVASSALKVNSPRK